MKRKILPYGSLLKRVFNKYIPTKRGNTQFPKKQDKVNQKRAVKKSERQVVRKIIKNEVLQSC
jgi:hypothetical protein